MARSPSPRSPSAQAPAPIGHNMPDDDIDYAKPVIDRLDKDLGHLIKDIEGLEAELSKLPAAIDSDETQGTIEDVIGKARDKLKAMVPTFEAEKRPYLIGGRAVDNWFKRLRERLEAASAAPIAVSNAWTLAKAERERVARAAAEAAAREAEAKVRREREEAEKAARDAAEAAARKRNADTKAAADEAARIAQEAADKLRAEEQAAMRATDDATEAAQARSADMARTRHAGGRMNTVAQVPDVRIIDPAKLDLEKLRPYIKPDHLQAALDAFAKFTNYKGECEGAYIGKKDAVARR